LNPAAGSYGSRSVCCGSAARGLKTENWYDLIADNMTEGAGGTIEIDGREYFILMTPFQQ
jgi:hypothetical protein